MRSVLLFLLLAAVHPVRAQQTEFGVYGNGLIYSDTTMRQLHRIVDSMNLKYRACDAWKKYAAVSQARGHFIRLERGNIAEAYQDLQRNMPYADFRKKYPRAKFVEDKMVIRRIGTHTWGAQEGKPYLDFSAFAFGGYDDAGVELDDTTLMSPDLKSGYAASYRPKSKDEPALLQAFYFPDGFRSDALTPAYAAAVQYVDCMVDTAETVFFENAGEQSFWTESHESRASNGPAYLALDSFLITTVMRWNPSAERLASSDSNWHLAVLRDSVLKAKLDTLARTTIFSGLLAAASREAMRKQEPNMSLEFLAVHYGDPATALHLMRSREVIGGCSRDLSPRYHALRIAKLAARTLSWDIFLRAHLDIMNDNFQRVSDGSYAWAGRQTYLRELEELDFDVETLLIGISLRISNPSGNHYYGSISRIGRALAEYRKKDALERKILAMVSDPQLDNYNRVLMYYLYSNYQYYRDEAARKAAPDGSAGHDTKTLPDAGLVQARKTLPAYIQDQIALAGKR